MLIERSGAFNKSERDYSQTGGNVYLLQLELNYFCIGIPSEKVFSKNLHVFEVTMF